MRLLRTRRPCARAGPRAGVEGEGQKEAEEGAELIPKY